MDIKTAEAYNKQLGELKAKAETLRSKRGVYQSQLEESCKKLTDLLGMPVTPDNLEQVYKEYMAKVENTVQAGMEIMRRIQAGQAQDAVCQQAPGVGQQGTPVVTTEVTGMEATVFTAAPTAPVGSPAPGVFGQAPTMAPPVAPRQAPEAPGQAPEVPLLWGGGTVAPDGHTWGSPAGQGGMIQI